MIADPLNRPPTASAEGVSPISVSLVVPVKNEQGSLHALVESILQQSRQPDEVIIVDGGSTDATVQVAKSLTADDPRFRIIEAGDATPGRGRNIGTKVARCDWIAFTDAGIVLEPTWLERLVEASERRPCPDVVYGNYEPVVETLFERCAALVYVPPKQCRGSGRARGPCVPSSMMHRRVIEGVGGFPDLRAAEDLVFMERVAEQRFRIVWAPAAVVHWKLQPSFTRTFRRFMLYSKVTVWAGRLRHWQYGVARMYVAGVVVVTLSLLHQPLWLAALVGGLLFRVGKSIWIRRHDARERELLNPMVWLGVMLIMVTIDAAMFAGWASAYVRGRRQAMLPLSGG